MGSERTHHKDIKSEKCFEISLSTQRYSVLKFEFPAIFFTIFSNDMAENWLARPLSAVRSRIVLSSFRACFLSLVTLVLGGCAFWRRLLTVLLTELVCSVSGGLIADSTLATISVSEILVGVNVEFNLSAVAKPQCCLRTLRIN